MLNIDKDKFRPGQRWIQERGSKELKDYEPTFDFNEVYTIDNIEEKKGWDGYIDRDGKFYPTKPTLYESWNGSCNLHSDYADEYLYFIEKIDPDEVIRHLEKEGKITGWRLRGPKDYVVNIMGWVSMGYSRFMGNFVVVPEPEYNNMVLTQAQKDLAKKMYEMNGFEMADYYRKFEDKEVELTPSELAELEQWKALYSDEEEGITAAEEILD